MRGGTNFAHNLFLGGYCARLIENSLHWVLDVCFREDDQRHWAGNSAKNLAWLRKLALCLQTNSTALFVRSCRSRLLAIDS